MVTLFVTVFQFLLLVGGFLIEEKRKADAEGRQFKLDQALIHQTMDKATAELRRRAAEESAQAQSVEDRIDQDRKPPGGSPDAKP